MFYTRIIVCCIGTNTKTFPPHRVAYYAKPVLQESACDSPQKSRLTRKTRMRKWQIMISTIVIIIIISTGRTARGVPALDVCGTESCARRTCLPESRSPRVRCVRSFRFGTLNRVIYLHPNDEKIFVCLFVRVCRLQPSAYDTLCAPKN